MKIITNENKFYLLIFIFFYLLIYNIGPIGEIHSVRSQTFNQNFYEFIFPNWENLNFYVLNPVGYYLDYGYAKYFSSNKFLTAIYKTSIIFISFIFYNFFLNKFLNFKFTIFLTFLIFLSPNSDSYSNFLILLTHLRIK